MIGGAFNPGRAVTAPIEVADAIERKTLATYDSVFRGMLVEQADEPNILWQLLGGTDVTVDANWYGFPRTNADGELEGPIINRTGTAAANELITPQAGEMLVDTDQPLIRVGTDGTTAGGDFHVVPSRVFEASPTTGTLLVLSVPGIYVAFLNVINEIGFIPGVTGRFTVFFHNTEEESGQTFTVSARQRNGAAHGEVTQVSFTELDGESGIYETTTQTVGGSLVGCLDVIVRPTSGYIAGYYQKRGSLTVT